MINSGTIFINLPSTLPPPADTCPTAAVINSGEAIPINIAAEQAGVPYWVVLAHPGSGTWNAVIDYTAESGGPNIGNSFVGGGCSDINNLLSSFNDQLNWTSANPYLFIEMSASGSGWVGTVIVNLIPSE